MASSSSTSTWCMVKMITSMCVVLIIIIIMEGGGALAFKCSGSSGKECNGLVGYVPRNQTTLSHIQTMFGVRTLYSLLGANNLPLSTSSSYPIKPLSTINIPFRCKCNNGTGMPLERVPMYTVKKDDGLWHIAAEVFSGLVTFQQIQDANDILDANKIEPGQKLWIPLPCSCDQLVNDQNVLHYGHVVKSGTTIEQIAQHYGTTNTTLLQLNDLPSSKALLADTPLDVPLKACTSMVETNSLDYPLLIGDGTYAFTAGDCVMCKCDAATNNWTLQCEPSSSAILVRNSSSVCPSMQCQGGNLYLGNATSSSSSCNHTTCSYAGYTNQTTILTTLSSHSTCAVSDKNSARKISMQGWTWGYLLIILMVLCLRVVQ